MRKKKVSGLLLTLLLFGTLTWAFNVQPVKASGTIYIRPDGTVEGTDKIQRDGDIYTFTDNIYDIYGIVVEKDNIVVDGVDYTLESPSTPPVYGNGIDLSGRSNVTIKNLEIKLFLHGVLLNHSSSNTISGNNLISNTAHGILLNSSNGNRIFGNNITDSTTCGISLSGSSSNTISGNSITVNLYWGVLADVSSNHNTISGNSITDNRWGIAVDGSNNTISGNSITDNSEYGIALGGSSNTISGNYIAENWKAGIWLEHSSNNTILGNSVTGNEYGALEYGIRLAWSSNYNTISENSITGNEYGISVFSSSSNTVFGNNITNNDWNGIWVVTDSTYNSISGNNITNNGNGILLESSSDYNTISGNNIMQNNGYGIELDSSNYNSIYHNNFVDNIDQVHSYGSANVWDEGYPSGGNYWSDHFNVDDYSAPNQDEPGSDGIIDEPYTIDADDQDTYPLMGPIRSFNAGTWGETTYQVDAVSNSTVSDFHFSESEKLISFDVIGPDDTIGFCRVTIPNVLLGGPYVVLVNDSPPTTISERSNGTHTFIYFTYSHSTKTAEIIGTTVIPEFSSWISILLVFIVLAVAIVIYKRRLLKTLTH